MGELIERLNNSNQEVNNSNDVISRQGAIDALKRLQKDISGDYTELDPMVMAGCGYIGDCIGEIQDLPSAQPEQLTDTEQRIFLAAMAKEEKVCKQVDDEFGDPYEDSLVKTCHEITRKVKGALWTI